MKLKIGIKTGTTILLGALILVLAGLPVLGQPDPPAFMDDHFTSPERPPARFDHDGHADFEGAGECQACHHAYEDGRRVPDQSSEDQRCADCHPVAPQGRETRLVLAYHRLCQGCHETTGKGPLTCGECHLK